MIFHAFSSSANTLQLSSDFIGGTTWRGNCRSSAVAHARKSVRGLQPIQALFYNKPHFLIRTSSSPTTIHDKWTIWK